MKIKIVEPGWEGYSGMLGSVEFVEGVSVGKVDEREAYRLSTIVRVEGTNGEDLVALNNESIAAVMCAPVENVIYATAELEENVELMPEADAQTGVEITREYLESVADKGGIKALRAVAKPFGVANTSINGLIDEILAASGKPAPAAAMLAAVQE